MYSYGHTREMARCYSRHVLQSAYASAAPGNLSRFSHAKKDFGLDGRLFGHMRSSTHSLRELFPILPLSHAIPVSVAEVQGGGHRRPKPWQGRSFADSKVGKNTSWKWHHDGASVCSMDSTHEPQSHDLPYEKRRFEGMVCRMARVLLSVVIFYIVPVRFSWLRVPRRAAPRELSLRWLRSWYIPLERQELRSAYWVLRSYYDPQSWGFPPCSRVTMFLAVALRSRYVQVTFLVHPLRTAGITFRLLGFTSLLRSSDLGFSPMLRRDYVPGTPCGVYNVMSLKGRVGGVAKASLLAL